MATTTSTTTHVLKWNRLACDAVYYAQMPTTVAARALAMVHTAMYDAWTVYTDGPEMSTTTGTRFKKGASCTYQNREKAYSFAAFRVLESLFRDKLPAEHQEMFTDCMRSLKYNPNDDTLDPKKASGIGNLSAKLLIECRLGDGSNEANDYEDYTGYMPKNLPPPKRPLAHPGKWQPRRYDDGRKLQKFLTPHWGLVKPFALPDGSACRPEHEPHDAESDAFTKQLGRVKYLSACLDDYQKITAEFWSGRHEEKFDDVPVVADCGYWTVLPVQCCRIGQYLVEKNGFQNANAIKLFFALTNAVFDASIGAWDAKVCFDYCRPISVIHELDDNKEIDAWGGPCEGPTKMQGEGWNPYLLETPPYAEYVSGHSAMMRAMADTVTWLCGTNAYGKEVTFPACSAEIEPACTPADELTLCWPTLHDAANEAGLSRQYAGTNFDMSDHRGHDLGEQVANWVCRKLRFYFEGC